MSGARHNATTPGDATAVERIATLSSAKRALLARRLHAAAPGGASPRPHSRPAGLSTFPLSPAQERLWFLTTITSSRSAHNVTGTLRLTGPLDVEALAWGLTRLVERHETLRTVIGDVDGRAVQVVCSAPAAALRRVDLRSTPAPAREDALARVVAEQAHRPFDLALGPLWRATLVALADELHVLAVTLHHLVADASAVRVLVEELMTLAVARASGAEPALPPLPFQYVDYALWQRGLVARGTFARAVADWRRELAGSAPWLCPLDRTRPAAPTFEAAVTTRQVPRPAGWRLGPLCAATRSTPFMVFLGAYALVLARWAGRPDVCVLSPVANRDVAGTERCVGLFVNVVPVRVDVDPGGTFADLLRAVRGRAVRAAARQHVPFELLAAALASGRRIDRAPLSVAAFAVEDARSTRWTTGPLTIELEEAQRETVETDLLLTVRSAGADLSLRLEYARDLFEAATMTDLLAEYARVLDWALTHPDRPLADVPVARRPARGAVTSARPSPTLLETWTARVAASSSRTAIVEPCGRRVTYGSLDAEAGALASALRRRGAGREDVVAVLGRRSAGFVAAMLGVLKAGSAFLPLNPALPVAYLRQLVAGARPRLLLADDGCSTLGGALADDGGARCPLLTIADGVAADGGAGTGAAADPRPAPGDLAYVVFTSGSSGRPKGVMIEHRGLQSHLRAKIALLGLGESDRVAHTAPVSFDIAIWQWLAPLLAGGTVEIIADDDARAPAGLVDQLQRRQVTVVELVPSLLRAVLDELDDRAPNHPPLTRLRRMILTGEPLDAALCRRWLARYPRTPLVNAYGPTECSDDVTHCEVAVPPQPERVRVPIGWPIEGVSLYVDDGGMVPARPGRRGELCVGGVAVGRGYAHDPARTAAAFVPDPGSDDPAARVYRTGDVVHVLADGQLDLIGRRDRQVKVAGCRIELEEIEARLKACASVRDAAVAAHDGRLVAYVVPAAADATSRAWRAYLAERVPPPMVPHRFVTVPALPRTAHLKVDRRALAGGPSPDDHEVAAHAVGTVHERLRGIWQELLQRRDFGADDDFFELGGDSLLSIQASARARRLGLYFTPRDLFEHPTIARLAARVRPEPDRPPEQGLVVGPVPLGPSQAALLAHGPGAAGRHVMVMAFEAAGPVDHTLLRAALERLVLHHDALRLRFTETAGAWTQSCVRPEGGLPVRRVVAPGTGTRAWRATSARVVRELRGSLDLARGPVAAVALVEGGATASVRLVVVVHHLVCDTMSAHVLRDDLEHAYRRLAAGLDVSLPHKTTSVRAWAEALAAYARSSACRAQLPFWLRQLDEPAAERGRDGARAARAAVAVRAVAVGLDPSTTARLARQGGPAVHALLLAAFVRAIEPLVETPSLVVTIATHGRGALPGVDLSRSVGWFASEYPLRFGRTAVRSLPGAVADVRERLDAVPAGGIGFGALRYLGGEDEAGALGRRARPAWKFNHLGTVAREPEAAHLVTPLEPSSGAGGLHDPATAPGLELTAVTLHGCLRLHAAYRTTRHRRASVVRLLARMRASLEWLASGARSSS